MQPCSSGQLAFLTGLRACELSSKCREDKKIRWYLWAVLQQLHLSLYTYVIHELHKAQMEQLQFVWPTVVAVSLHHRSHGIDLDLSDAPKFLYELFEQE